jgi:hypothetical protein
VERASALLECKEATKLKLERRVDSLLARGFIELKNHGASCRLGEPHLL